MNEERKLATIRRISSVVKHPNADALDIVKVDGWQCVAKLGQFKEGDLCIYIEIDSIPPDREEFNFLKKDNGNMRTIKTVKLRGELSQGICFPITILMNTIPDQFGLSFNNETGNVKLYYEGEVWYEFNIGDDVTEFLGVTKYEKPIPNNMQGVMKGSFPTNLCPRTDEERIQNINIHQYDGMTFDALEKLDGTSATYILNNDEFIACSRNMELDPTMRGNVYWRIVDQYNLESILRERRYTEFAVQGEIIGSNIQGNNYKLQGIEFRVFNVFDIARQEYIPWREVRLVCNELGLKTVPEHGKITISPEHDRQYFLDKSEIKSALHDDVWCEGSVYRSIDRNHPLYNKISFKVLSNKYLLKYDK